MPHSQKNNNVHYQDKLCKISKQIGDDRLDFTLSGEIDLDNLQGVSNWVMAHLDHSHEIVILQIEELTYLDSAGISWLFQLARILKSHSQELHFKMSTEHPLLPLFSLVSLSKVSTIIEEDVVV